MSKLIEVRSAPQRPREPGLGTVGVGTDPLLQVRLEAVDPPARALCLAMSQGADDPPYLHDAAPALQGPPSRRSPPQPGPRRGAAVPRRPAASPPELRSPREGGLVALQPSQERTATRDVDGDPRSPEPGPQREMQLPSMDELAFELASGSGTGIGVDEDRQASTHGHRQVQV